MLRSFAVVREHHMDALEKVEALDSDLSLRLSDADAKRLSEVSVILHCAASIVLHDKIQRLLRNNYLGTRNLLDFAAARLPRLAAYVHTSSMSVGFGSAPGSTVAERVRPLMLGDMAISDAQLASQLLAMEPHSAHVEACYLVRRWGLRTPYVLTKRMAELLVERYHNAGVLPCAIVRPSSIVSLAGAPRPGYMGNWATFASLIAGYTSGFYSPGAVATRPDSVLDAVPADVSAAVVLAAGLALAAGVRGQQQLHAAAAAAGVPAAITPPPRAEYGAPADGRATDGDAGADSGGAGGAWGEIMVFHAATTASRPLSYIFFYDRMFRFFEAHRPQPAWPLPGLTPRSQVRVDASYEPNPGRVAAAKREASDLVRRSSFLLRMLGRESEAKSLNTSLVAWQILNSDGLEEDFTFNLKNVVSLEGLIMVPVPPTPPPLPPSFTGVPAPSAAAAAEGGAAAAAAPPGPLLQLQPQPQLQPLLPVLWRADWGPLLDAMMADVVQRMMGIKLVPPPPPPPPPAPSARAGQLPPQLRSRM